RVDPLEFLPAARACGDAQSADPPPAGGVPGLLLEGLIGLDALAHQLRQALALRQRHVGLPALREVVGDARADDAAADDDDLAALRNAHGPGSAVILPGRLLEEPAE